MSHPINVEVRFDQNMSQEKFLKKFLKKCKNENIIKEFLEKTAFYLSPSEKRRAKRRKNKFLREKKK